MIKFSKMNGNGNNFLVLENFSKEYSEEKLRALAIEACNTKFSIGADGILVIEKSDKADFKMRLFNSNGAEGEMCGNGARCIVKYAFSKGLTGREVNFETLAGIIHGTILGNEVSIFMAEIDMDNIFLNQSIMIENRNIRYSGLTVGVPHCVIYSDMFNITNLEDMRNIGRYLDNNKEFFPQGVNTNFVQILNNSSLNVVTYERGVEDITESCGTGSCASVIVSTVLHNMQLPVLVKNLGGDNKVYLEFDERKKMCKVNLQGKAELCAEIFMLEKES